VRTKGDGESKDRTMEEDDGFGFWIGGVAEVIDVAIWAQAADDGGAGWRIQGLALGADGDLAIVADTDAGLLAPDKRPPRAGRDGTQDGAFSGEGLRAGGVRGGAEFAMDFVLVDVGQELVEEAVGPFEFKDLVGGQEWREAFLPVVVAALDFAFGLGCGRVAEGDAVEVQGGAELGEGVGVVGVEEGVEVHIPGQGQAVGFEDAGQEIKMGQEGFAGVEACAGVVTGGIVQNIEQRLFVGLAGQPGVGAGVVLPEGPQIAGLPAFDGFGRGFVAGVRGELVFEGPAANAGAVGFKIETAVEFAGTSAVGRGRFGSEEFVRQGQDLRRPSGMMIAAGKSGRPNLGLTFGASAEVLAVKFVEARPGQAQFPGRLTSGKRVVPMAGQEVTDDGGRQAFDQL
jgi:hypothetical protein